MQLIPKQALAAAFAVLVAVLAPTAAGATAPLPYEKAAFNRAVAARGPVVVHFAASWCPTCQLQKPIVMQLLQEPQLHRLKLFVADYDRERALKSALHVTQQSTFVVFRDGVEVARSTGQSSRDAIRTTFRNALPRQEWFRPADPAASPASAGVGFERTPATGSPTDPINFGNRP